MLFLIALVLPWGEMEKADSELENAQALKRLAR